MGKNVTILLFAGFSGYNCEINVNNCGDGSCSGNGICVDLPNSHKCYCYSGKASPKVQLTAEMNFLKHDHVHRFMSSLSLSLPLCDYSGITMLSCFFSFIMNAVKESQNPAPHFVFCQHNLSKLSDVVFLCKFPSLIFKKTINFKCFVFFVLAVSLQIN